MDEIFISSGHLGDREYLKVRAADGVTFYDWIILPEVFASLRHEGPGPYLKVSTVDGVTCDANAVPNEMRLHVGFEPIGFLSDDEFVQTMFATPQQRRYLQYSPWLRNDHFEGTVESFSL